MLVVGFFSQTSPSAFIAVLITLTALAFGIQIVRAVLTNSSQRTENPELASRRQSVLTLASVVGALSVLLFAYASYTLLAFCTLLFPRSYRCSAVLWDRGIRFNPHRKAASPAKPIAASPQIAATWSPHCATVGVPFCIWSFRDGLGCRAWGLVRSGAGCVAAVTQGCGGGRFTGCVCRCRIDSVGPHRSTARVLMAGLHTNGCPRHDRHSCWCVGRFDDGRRRLDQLAHGSYIVAGKLSQWSRWGSRCRPHDHHLSRGRTNPCWEHAVTLLSDGDGVWCRSRVARSVSDPAAES